MPNLERRSLSPKTVMKNVLAKKLKKEKLNKRPRSNGHLCSCMCGECRQLELQNKPCGAKVAIKGEYSMVAVPSDHSQEIQEHCDSCGHGIEDFLEEYRHCESCSHAHKPIYNPDEIMKELEYQRHLREHLRGPKTIVKITPSGRILNIETEEVTEKKMKKKVKEDELEDPSQSPCVCGSDACKFDLKSLKGKFGFKKLFKEKKQCSCGS